MTFELPPEEAHELGTGENLEIQTLLENPESAFVHRKLTPEQYKEAQLFHELIIANPGLIIGSGNDGVVFEPPSENSSICYKNIWEEISVEMKNHSFYLLPPKLQELRKIQEYFERIKEKRRAARERGVEFVASNTPSGEAGLQVAARAILEEAGFENAVPGVKSIIRLETKGGEEVDGLPFMFNEVADIIAMDRVKGKSVQDFILNYEKYEDVLAKLDPILFRKQLREMMQALHDRNLTHQDVTNRNIMIDFSTMKPVIIDFGKAVYGLGNFTKEEEMGHIDAVCRMLATFKNNPEQGRKELKRLLKIDF